MKEGILPLYKNQTSSIIHKFPINSECENLKNILDLLFSNKNVIEVEHVVDDNEKTSLIYVVTNKLGKKHSLIKALLDNEKTQPYGEFLKKIEESKSNSNSENIKIKL